MQNIGKIAEKIAIKFLSDQKLSFIVNNFYSPFGEIDIIMLDKKLQILVFIEVKMRSRNNYGYSQEMISHKKKQKIKFHDSDRRNTSKIANFFKFTELII